jgi:cupin fold WbuC family metalloprotein
LLKNTLYEYADVFVLDSDYIGRLKEIALQHPLRRSRVCLHKDSDSLVQEMVIVAHQQSVISPHCHPKLKTESYHVIDGTLAVNIFSEDGQIIRTIHLFSDNHPRMYRIEGGVWHQPIPQSEWVVYHEVFTGPFLKDRDVRYAQW